MHVGVEFLWTPQGEITVEAGKLRFPDVADRPGVYRFALRAPEASTTYIGEADRLRRRFLHYRNPGPTQRTNQRLNEAMTALLQAGGAVTLSTVTEATIEIDGQRLHADLSRKSCRLLVENAALVAAQEAGETVANL